MRARGEDGFTLIETLVALVIMIGVATLLYRGFSGALTASSAAEGAEAALLVAQSRLAALGIETPLAPGVAEGREGEASWRIAVRPYAAAAEGDGLTAGPKAFWATVTVVWRERFGGRHSLQLTTVKLERAP
jgi:general secretion pathway protein I